MRLAIIGSRGWLELRAVSRVLDGIRPSEIVTGGAAGVDSFAEARARLHQVPCMIFYPDWERHGRRAGAIRNKQIVDYCDRLVAFWDGRSKGTKISIDMAMKAGKLEKVYLE